MIRVLMGPEATQSVGCSRNPSSTVVFFLRVLCIRGLVYICRRETASTRYEGNDCSHADKQDENVASRFFTNVMQSVSRKNSGQSESEIIKRGRSTRKEIKKP
jgi:hypothetical protein